MFHLIYSMACALVQDALTEGEQALLAELCRTAEAALTGRLRAGVTADDCASAFIPAAAWMALAGFTTGREAAAPPASFRAGDVSVTCSGVGGAAASRGLLEQAERVMAPWLEDGGFAFRGVRG